MTPLFYSRQAFRALAALPRQAQATVRQMAESLQKPGETSAPVRALPGGLEHNLAQVAVEGVGRLVCRVDATRIDILAIVPRDHALPPSARRLATETIIGGAMA